MGVFYQSAFFGGLSRPGEASDIAADSQLRPVKAMRSARVGDDWLYVGEQDMLASLTWKQFSHKDFAERIRWTRMEFRRSVTHGVGEYEIGAGDHLVVTEWPYSNGWVTHARFKLGSRKKRADLNSESYEDGMTLIRALESLPYDYWETGSYVTAGISMPSAPHAPSENLRMFKVDRLFVYGVCHDFDLAVNEIVRTDFVQAMVDRVVSGKLDVGRFGSGRRLHPRTREDRNYLALLAVRQALAGPVDGRIKVGEPTTRLFDFIFRDHLYNSSRRNWDRDDNEARFKR
jgi:hypothetical protein